MAFRAPRLRPWPWQWPAWWLYSRWIKMPFYVTGRLQGASATAGDYRDLFQPAERPHKFSAAEVGFVERGPSSMQCRACRHWFFNPAWSRAVCEIMRLPGERSVPGMGSCRFWNVDQVEFPLLRVL